MIIKFIKKREERREERGKMEVGSWELGVGSWELGVGSWELGVGRLKIEVIKLNLKKKNRLN